MRRFILGSKASGRFVSVSRGLFVCAAAAAFSLAANTSFAAQSFTATFDGTDGSTNFGPNLTLPASPGNYQIQSNQAANPGVFDNDGKRTYVRTVDGNYGTVDFTADITFTRNAGTGNPQGAFFGIGSGTPDGGWYGVPDASIFLETFALWGPMTRFSANAVGSGGQVDAAYGSATSMPVSTTSSFRMSKTGTNLQFMVDVGSATFGAADFSSNVIDLTGLLGDSYLFFGGENNVTWDNFTVSVVPEPSSVALLALGTLGLAALRRRKRS